MNARYSPVNWLNGYPRQVRPYFAALFRAAQRLDRTARVTSTVRSRSEQARLYRRYLAGKSRFPAAPPGRSKHQLGRAIDIIARPEVLRMLGEAWERLGPSFRWGGRFNDAIHFEL